MVWQLDCTPGCAGVRSVAAPEKFGQTSVRELWQVLHASCLLRVDEYAACNTQLRALLWSTGGTCPGAVWRRFDEYAALKVAPNLWVVVFFAVLV